MEIRQSYNCLISTMGVPILIRWHLYIESGPRPLTGLLHWHWTKSSQYSSASEATLNNMGSSLISQYNTVQWHYNMVNSIPNSHKRHSITHLLGWGMGCDLCIQSTIYKLPETVQSCVSCDIGPCYHGTPPYMNFTIILQGTSTDK